MLCTEIYKTINKLNPELMNNIFEVRENKRLVREQYRAIETPEWNQVTVRKKSLKVHAPNIVNSLPFHIKLSIVFKRLMKNWNGYLCSCVLFFYYEFYKILHRYIISCKDFADPTENDLSC